MTTMAMRRERPDAQGNAIDRFIPSWHARERHEVLVRAPAEIVFDVACNLDIQSIPMIRAIFRLRSLLLGARDGGREPVGLVTWTTRLGWEIIGLRPRREIVLGAVTKPWEPSPRFEGVCSDRFRSYAEPGKVKI